MTVRQKIEVPRGFLKTLKQEYTGWATVARMDHNGKARGGYRQRWFVWTAQDGTARQGNMDVYVRERLPELLPIMPKFPKTWVNHLLADRGLRVRRGNGRWTRNVKTKEPVGPGRIPDPLSDVPMSGAAAMDMAQGIAVLMDNLPPAEVVAAVRAEIGMLPRTAANGNFLARLGLRLLLGPATAGV